MSSYFPLRFFILSVTPFQSLFYGKNTTVVIFVIAGFLFAFRFLIKIIQKIIRDNLPLKFSFFLNFLFLLIQYLYNIVNLFLPDNFLFSVPSIYESDLCNLPSLSAAKISPASSCKDEMSSQKSSQSSFYMFSVLSCSMLYAPTSCSNLHS